ncbi:rho guanine nucleotide exchange factor 17-like, partial [Limulus polyphemus]|uniref:Rho guanine nucleotide exchange factor 17-like n=1 Tax=Limulus polyphemus TaxID=6850 RepID=A0ABM1SEG2_LIMPO
MNQVSSVSHFNEENSEAQVRIQSKKSPFDDILSSLEKICDEFEVTSAEIHCENNEKKGDSNSHLENSGDVRQIFSDSTVSSRALSYLDKTKYCICSYGHNTACKVPFSRSNARPICDNDDCCSLCLPEDFSNTNFEDNLKDAREESLTNSNVSNDFLCECLELGLSFKPEFFGSKSGDAKTQYPHCKRKLSNYDNIDNITFNDESKDALTFRFETRMDSGAKSSKYYTFNRSDRVNNKASKVQLIPNFRITTLTKVPPTATELESTQASRSLPSTPLASRAHFQVRSKPDLPAYLTLGRKGGLRRGSEGNKHDILSYIAPNHFVDAYTETKDVKQIRKILAGLDFSKYRRGRSEEQIETKSKTSFSSNKITENVSNDFKELYRDRLFLSKFNETTKSFHGSLTEVKPTKELDNIFQRSTSLLDSLNHNFQCSTLCQYQVNDTVNTSNIIVNNSQDPGKFRFSTLRSRKSESNPFQRTPDYQHKHPPHHPFITMNHSKSLQSVSGSTDKNGNKKLKQLTEKLKSQSSSTVPSSPSFSSAKDSESSEPSGRKSPLVNRSSSFSHVDVTLEGGYVMSSDCSNRDSTYSLISGLATLPRKKITQFSSLSDKGHTSSNKPVKDNALIPPNLELNQSDLLISSVVDSVVDEGLVSDSDCPSYSHEYSSVTTSSSQSCDSKSLVSFIRNRTNTYAGVELGTHSLPSEARKRRKGFRGHTVGFKLGSHESKSSNGRLLTYPPQRRCSKSDDELEYTSVDSNGLKSLKTSPGLSLPLSEDPLHQTSDLSLADSHFSHGESFRDETYRDILDKLTGESNHVTLEERNVKALKKKYHSDPSRGNTGKNVDLPEIITTCNSESMLRSFDSSNEIQQPELRLGIKESLSDDANLVLSDLTNHQTKQGLGCSPPQTRLSGPDFDLDKEKLMTRSPQQQRRYSKKRLRGPYGEMLEEEMRKSGEKQKTNFSEELSFLQELSEEKPKDDSQLFSEYPSRPCSLSTSQSLDDTDLKKPSLSESGILRRKTSANIPLVQSDSDSEVSHLSPPPVTVFSSDPNISQSPSDLQVCENNATSWNQQQDALVFELRKQSELTRSRSLKKHQDTRTHVVGELYDTEKSYVESLQILVNKYMKPLKSPENAGIVDSYLVDEIFHQIPEILVHHESFLEMLRQRLANWDTKQKVGDVFVEAFTKQHVIDTYTAFINNWKSAKDSIKLTTQAKPAFQKFLEHMAREHKGKLTLDALLIMPVQRIPRYELLIKELLKHTPVDHPDHQSLVLAQKEVHELAVQINRMEREAFQHEQMQQKIRDVEHLIEGVMDLVQPDRTFIRYDLVTISGALSTKKERCIFLFSDLLIITSIKRKSGTIRKTSSFSTSPSPFGSLEMNKCKMLMRFSLDNLDIVK